MTPLPAGVALSRGRAWASEGDVSGIVGGGEEAADAVAEMDDGGVGEADGLFQAGGIAGGFVEGEGGAGHVGLIVEQAGGGDTALTPGVLDAVIRAGKFAQDEVAGRGGAGEPVGAVEHGGGANQAADRQAVPVGEHLVVAAGADAFCPRFEQVMAGAGESGFLFIGAAAA